MVRFLLSLQNKNGPPGILGGPFPYLMNESQTEGLTAVQRLEGIGVGAFFSADFFPLAERGPEGTPLPIFPVPAVEGFI